jgi:anti-sigma factor ChrR (cupin superfamily)
MGSNPCDGCGADKPSQVLTGVGAFCDRCADARIAQVTGWPTLPEPPAPVVLTGPDRREHTLRYRLWRAPTGISIDLVEVKGGDDEGYEFSVLGTHDADITALIENVTAEARAEIANPSLSDDHGRTVIGDGDEVRGRVSHDPDGGPCRVVIDGRAMDWDELGHLLASYEGWRFRLTLTDRCGDVRPDADILDLPTGRGGERR